MPLFRRSDPARERTPEEREYARRLRDARRQGLPDPPRPEEPVENGDGGQRQEAADAPAADEAYEPAPEALEHEGGPDEGLEPGPVAPEPEVEAESEPEAAVQPEPPAPEPEPVEPPEPEPIHEPEPTFEEPAPTPAEPSASAHDDEIDLTWTEPVREPRAPEPGPASPPVEPPSEPVPVESAPEPAAQPPPTEAHAAEPPDDLPPARDLDHVPVAPPPLPARAAARPLPTPPRRRYAGSDARRSPAGPPARRRRRWVGRILAVLALVLVAVVLWFLFSLFQPGKGDGHGKVSVVVPRGATSRQVGDLLADKGVVSSGFFFDLRTRISGKRDDLQAGRFDLAQDMSYGAAIDKLGKTPAAPPPVKLTISEGRSRREIAPQVKQAGIKGSYLAASDRHAGFHPSRYGAPRSTKTLEGFLFPATYELAPGQATAARLVGEQLAAFKRSFATVSMQRAKRKNLTPYDVLIIASMIEREAQVAKERPLISAVIYNRLKDGMPLGIDATTRYELNQWSRPLRVSELQRDTPYNTRTRRGLPPTPIGNPGLASIKAAANPSSAHYLYYVVKPGTCGQHNFSSSDAEFQRDVAAYEAARAKNGGKSPTKC